MSNENADPIVVAWCEWGARFCAFALTALGTVVLIGWTLDISALKSVLPGLATMKSNAALGFLLSGASLVTATQRPTRPGWRFVRLALAGPVTLLGLLTLGEFVFAADFGIDSLFFAPAELASTASSSRMALGTAGGLASTGLALLLLDSRRGLIGSQFAAIVGGLTGILALLGYAYGVASLYQIGPFSSMALHSAAGLVAINLGVLLARPERGLMAVVTSKTVGGFMIRRLLPLVLIAPLVIGWLRIKGEQKGLYSSEFGVALVTFTYMILFATFFWRTAEALRYSAQRRIVAESDQRQQQAQLAGVIDSAMDAIIMVDAAQRIILFNPAAEQMFGRQAANVFNEPLDMLLPPRFRDMHAEHVRNFGATGTTSRRMGRLGALTGVRANGDEFPIEASISQLQKNGDKFFTVILRDNTERKAAEDEVTHLAFYDPLTHLPNQRLLRDRLRQALTTGDRCNRQSALLFIDLDNFKTLNDTLGHDHGDLLLQQVAQRLLICVRKGDTVARLGGDEFVVMLEMLGEASGAAIHATHVAEKILAALNQVYFLNGHEWRSTPSIGVALFGDKHETVESLLKQADLAMYQAKSAGRNAVRFFDPEMQAAVTAKAQLEADLRHAVCSEQFILAYQAQVDDNARLAGAEVLVRWLHPQRGLMLPDEFIPMAEQTGLIVPLGLWVLEAACAQLAAWSTRADTSHLTLAVNVSAGQLRQENFVEQVLTALDRNAADPSKLKLELTESQLMEDVEDTIAKMTALKARGVSMSLDDFGTGYSSLAYLKRLPLEQLKIDRSFVMDVLTDPNDAAIAQTIVALARSLGLAVVAEGVETEEQRAFLSQNGCHSYQGYLFSRPVPLVEFEHLLRQSIAMGSCLPHP